MYKNVLLLLLNLYRNIFLQIVMNDLLLKSIYKRSKDAQCTKIAIQRFVLSLYHSKGSFYKPFITSLSLVIDD